MISAGGNKRKNGEVFPDNITFVDQQLEISLCQLLYTFIM